MEITEVRVKLMEDPNERLQAFCSITFDDCFVVRDLKIIDGTNGLFVAMPSRKLADRCDKCRGKNHLRASFCNSCGSQLDPDRAGVDGRGRARLHADLAHPINSKCRTELHREIVAAMELELERSKQGDYVPRTFDDLDEVEDYVDAEYLAEIAHTGGGSKGSSAEKEESA